jgi:hypothetical protein
LSVESVKSESSWNDRLLGRKGKLDSPSVAERNISSSLFTEEDDLERESSKSWGVKPCSSSFELLRGDDGLTCEAKWGTG